MSFLRAFFFFHQPLSKAKLSRMKLFHKESLPHRCAPNSMIMHAKNFRTIKIYAPFVLGKI